MGSKQDLQPQTPQELLKLKNSPSKPIPPHRCLEGVKQPCGMKSSYPLFAISWAGKRCAVSCWGEVALRSCQHPPEAQFHVPWHVQALPQPRIRRSRAGARQPACFGSLPVPCAGGTAPAPRLMRWLPVQVNHLPGNARGVSEFLAPMDTPRCARLSRSRLEPLRRAFCNRKTPNHMKAAEFHISL